MAKQKLTPWFPADVRPVREGAYQRDYDGSQLGIAFPDYWDGKRWHIGVTKDEWEWCSANAPAPKKPWRGLASNPSKGAK